MWLYRAFPTLAKLSCEIFYKLQVMGEGVPATGPVLLVANHPNSLLDPFLVTVAARRPVRFLAKAPLLSDPLIGWGVRGVGAIPVYRRIDDPSLVSRNEEMFRAVHAAIAERSAVGIFPEGISHDEPSLVPIKTGAARIALGAAALLGNAFPIIPIGSVFECKEAFRSRAWVVVAKPIPWNDLAPHGLDDAETVRELTRRIEHALHQVTLNFESRDDAPLLASAAAIYWAEFGRPALSEQVPRLSAASRALRELRHAGDEEAAAITRDVQRHARVLALLGLTPAAVNSRADLGTAIRWTARKLPVSGLLAGVVLLVGTVLFWVPYQVTGRVAVRFIDGRDMLATARLLTGTLVFPLWILLLVILAGVMFGWTAAILSLIVLPALALATLSYGERWRSAMRDVRRFIVLRTRGRTMGELRQRQRALAQRLHALRERAIVNAPPS